MLFMRQGMRDKPSAAATMLMRKRRRRLHADQRWAGACGTNRLDILFDLLQRSRHPVVRPLNLPRPGAGVPLIDGGLRMPCKRLEVESRWRLRILSKLRIMLITLFKIGVVSVPGCRSSVT